MTWLEVYEREGRLWVEYWDKTGCWVKGPTRVQVVKSDPRVEPLLELLKRPGVEEAMLACKKEHEDRERT